MSRKADLRRALAIGPNRPGQKCRCCASPDIVRDLREWAAARTLPSPGPTLHGFWSSWILVNYPVPPSFTSVRGHVLRCMGLNPVTARPNGS